MEARLALLAAAAWRPATAAAAGAASAAAGSPAPAPGGLPPSQRAPAVAAVITASGTQVPVAEAVPAAGAASGGGGTVEAEAQVPGVAAELLDYCWALVFEAAGIPVSLPWCSRRLASR
jgi:hypothetical protein